MRFFGEAVQPRFPRTISEGIMKCFLLGGALLAAYDLLSSSKKTDAEQVQHSLRIILGYLFFLTMGAVLGTIGENYFNNERGERPRHPR